jgi:hypothetical protein
MPDIEEIVKQPGYDAAASGASKASILVFALTFAYMVFFSGVSPGIFGGTIFFLIGIFVVSLVVAAPLFLLKSKFPQLALVVSIADIAVTVFLTRFVYLWIFAQPTPAEAIDLPQQSATFEPRSFQCEEPLPEFTLNRTSDPTDEQLADLCACIYGSLGEPDKTISLAIVEGRQSDVSPADVQQFIPKFGAAVQSCGGGEL